ncbi:MAG: hypothetical protein M0C28_15835 [Candidatus Moduliflexus flocculans]|nr:hypothetical protein [Candidatus Moduliflexus flocculans]
MTVKPPETPIIPPEPNIAPQVQTPATTETILPKTEDTTITKDPITNPDLALEIENSPTNQILEKHEASNGAKSNVC